MQQVNSEDADMPARAALRDLIWRVEHMRDLLLQNPSTVDAQMVGDLLDTSEARRVIDPGSEETKANVSAELPDGGPLRSKSTLKNRNCSWKGGCFENK